MLRGLYTAASSLAANLRKNEITANNLVNVNTTGYKRKEVVEKSFGDVLLNRINYEKVNSPKNPIGKLGRGVIVDGVHTLHSQGNIVSTERPLDIALEGKGYFTVQDNDGRELCTRNGSFTLNSQGQLATQEGYLVLGEQGPINAAANNLIITDTGEIFAEEQLLDKLQIANIENPRNIGDSMFSGENPTPVADVQVRQGFLENSNVNSVEEMIKMIGVMRSYESNQKVVQAYDNTLDKVINEVGRV